MATECPECKKRIIEAENEAKWREIQSRKEAEITFFILAFALVGMEMFEPKLGLILAVIGAIFGWAKN